MSQESQKRSNINELLEDIRYVNQSTESEIQRVENHIRRNITEADLPQNVTDSFINEILVQFGQLAARVKLTEKAVHSLQSKQIYNGEAGGLHTGPKNTQPTSMRFSASQLDGNRNLFPIETSSEGISYSWSGDDPEIQFSFALDRGKKIEMQLRLFALIKPEYSKQLKVFIDGQHISHRFSLDGSLFVVSCVLPLLASPARTNIRVLLPGTHRPSELGSGGDNRTLGIAISEICFGKPGSNFSYLLRRLRLKK